MDLARYLEDASGFRGAADRLFTPATAEEVQTILRQASRERISVTVAGALTGVTGAAVAQRGWVLSTGKLNILEIGEGTARVGAGVSLRDLDRAARATGQFYPPDPTEWSASLGGSIATNASGSRSFRYGSTKRHVLELTAVFADGHIRQFQRGDPIDFEVPPIPHSSATKHSAGYLLRPGMDWIDLICGSEGTLCVVTEADLVLLPVPEQVLSGVVFFPSDELAFAAVQKWRPIPRLNMLEFLDRPSLDLLRPRFPEIPAAAQGALLIEQDLHHDDEIEAWIDRLEEAEAFTESSWFGAAASDRERFRAFRHALPEMVNDLVRRRGFLKAGSDYAVPLDQSRPMYAYYKQRLDQEFPGQYVIFGHAGDAHLHVNILPADEDQVQRSQALMIELASKAVELGGTVSAEHGLGKRKSHLLRIQYSPEAQEAMRAVKQRLDPNWILGRGNLFEPPIQPF